MENKASKNFSTVACILYCCNVTSNYVELQIQAQRLM
jgi:hypothetical protein